MQKIPPFKDLILYEDDHLIFINKPAYLSSLSERVQSNAPSVLGMAKKYWEDAQLCHRLDKETSGIMMIAKNPEMYRTIAMKFEAREIEKRYHAIVGGVLSIQQKSIVLPLAITRNGVAKIDIKEGKPAETIISTLYNWEHYTLLECKPVSGRLHQIRIHLAAQNFPIVSDTQYGGKVPMLSKMKRNFKSGKFEEEKGIMQRVALHAHALLFMLDDKEMHITAPYPKDMEVLIKLLDKHDKIAS
jgi:23S rRNA pseudouridine955/2504/2580 synthase